MHYQGICHKMRATITLDDASPATTVQYCLVLDQFRVPLNQFMGQPIKLTWTGQIFCVSCGAKTPKSYAQGHCFRCFRTAASCDLCVVKPETCHHHLGTCRDEQFAQSVCFQPHVVYLANSSGLKVGITRQSNLPTRWLDQGASQALPILQTGTRRMAGWVEVLLAQHMSDKTDWRKLLRGEAVALELTKYRDRIIDQISDSLHELQTAHPHDGLQLITAEPLQISYPVLHYPERIVSHNLDKTAIVEGQLQGIKGQYLILDTGVINLRKYSGYDLIAEL